MTKTNNTNLALKLDLRRTVLKASGLKKLRVLDLFAGGGEIWAALRQEFKVETYLPCDLDPETPGALRPGPATRRRPRSRRRDRRPIEPEFLASRSGIMNRQDWKECTEIVGWIRGHLDEAESRLAGALFLNPALVSGYVIAKGYTPERCRNLSIQRFYRFQSNPAKEAWEEMGDRPQVLVQADISAEQIENWSASWKSWAGTLDCDQAWISPLSRLCGTLMDFRRLADGFAKLADYTFCLDDEVRALRSQVKSKDEKQPEPREPEPTPPHTLQAFADFLWSIHKPLRRGKLSAREADTKIAAYAGGLYAALDLEPDQADEAEAE